MRSYLPHTKDSSQDWPQACSYPRGMQTVRICFQKKRKAQKTGEVSGVPCRDDQRTVVFNKIILSNQNSLAFKIYLRFQALIYGMIAVIEFS